MEKPVKRIRRKKTGLPPGSVVFTGNQKVETVFVHYCQYDNEDHIAKVLDNHEEIILHQSPDDKVDWYDVRGLHDTELIEWLGKTFQIHSLILEDVAAPYQRPKFEEYDNGIFIVIRALDFDKNLLKIKTEQVAIYFRQGLLFSFQENETDLLESIRTRIESGRGKIRQRGSDYLAYAILDTIIDHYYVVLDNMEEVIEGLEDEMLESPDHSVKERIHKLKKELLVYRKSINPLREAIGRFSKSDSNLIEESSGIFVRDLYDHTVQVMDMVETYRDILNGLQDLYISEISFRMNQVMQVLTLIATIFIPLTFLAGIYGMNFEYMPELKWKYAYFALLGIMAVSGIALVFLFKKKKWL